MSLTFWRALLAYLCVVISAKKEPPKGHLEPFGGWKPGTPIEERNDVPDPLEFFEKYSNDDGGTGKPFIMRGAAAQMGAMNWKNDDYLLENYGKEKIQGVEYQLKETRAGGQVPNMNKLSDFLKAYNSLDIYMVSKLSKRIREDINFLPCMRCGGFLSFLDVANMWMGRGGSASVIHYDDQDNINCMFSGSKRFVFMHPSYKKKFEANPNSDKNKYGWVDADLDRSIEGYGGFMGRVNASSMDLIKYPGWRNVDWFYADLQPGDCLYIPYQWYHQVTATPVRSINIHVWYWRPQKFDSKSCDADVSDSAPLSFADCSWGYEPPGGHLGVLKKGSKKPTKCKKPNDKKGVGGAEL